MTALNDKSRMLISAAGIFISYTIYGFLQEKVTRGSYGDEVNEDGSKGEKFTFTLALVGVQCLFNYLFAKGNKFCQLHHVISNNVTISAILIARPQARDATHTGYYACSALTYLLAMVSSNMALQWVAYPTQVVAKSAKPIPVMILGVIIGRKSYSMQKYFFILLIVVGVVLFMLKEGKVNSKTENSGIGELLLVLSLSMDGLTGAIQERMRAASKPSAQHMMLAMNYWSTIMLFAALIITGEGGKVKILGFAGIRIPSVYNENGICILYTIYRILHTVYVYRFHCIHLVYVYVLVYVYQVYTGEP
jgi:solute carrier family 35 (UDP-galactose transporter), member B1